MRLAILQNRDIPGEPVRQSGSGGRHSMSFRLTIVLMTIAAAVSPAQDHLAESLRKGVVEEESRHNLNAAIQQYQSVVAQFDEARATAATALFRMAECYRKQGKDAEAM